VHSVSKKELWGNCTLKRQLLNLLTQFIDLLEDNKQGCWFSARLGESPYCERTAFLQNFFGDRVDGRGI
jgi:hypothetical protein